MELVTVDWLVGGRSFGLVFGSGPNVYFGAGDAAGDREGLQTDGLDGGVHGDIGADFVEASAQVESSLEEIFRAHAVEVVFGQSGFDAGEIGREMLQFFFEGGKVFFLEFLDVNTLDHVDLGAVLGFPMEESGL